MGQAISSALGSKAGCCRMAWAEAQHGEAKAGNMGATGLGVEDLVEEKNRSYGLTFRLE